MTGRRLRSRVLAAVVVVLVGSCSSQEEAATSVVGGISAPDDVVAGVEVEVEVEAEGSGSIFVEVVDAFSSTRLTRRAEDRDGEDRLTFRIPDHLTQLSGVLTFRAHGAIGDAVVTSTLVLPSIGADPLDVLVGPRTVVADGADETMAIGFVTDRFGNPVLDGSIVDLTLIDESSAAVVLEATVDGGLASRLIGSGTLAQRVEVFASVDDGRIASRRVDYQEVPGPAAAIELSLPGIDAAPFVADGRTSIEVRTGEITDTFGNQLFDGRLVRLESVGPDGVGQLTARTIDGVARFSLVAPTTPGRVTLRADADGVSSASVDVDYSAAISALPVGVTADGLTVSIGPVLDARGAVVVDGTIAEVAVIHSSDGRSEPEVVEVQLIDGRATVDRESLASAGDGDVVVTVLGVVGSEPL